MFPRTFVTNEHLEDDLPDRVPIEQSVRNVQMETLQTTTVGNSTNPFLREILEDSSRLKLLSALRLQQREPVGNVLAMGPRHPFHQLTRRRDSSFEPSDPTAGFQTVDFPLQERAR